MPSPQATAHSADGQGRQRPILSLPRNRQSSATPRSLASISGSGKPPKPFGSSMRRRGLNGQRGTTNVQWLGEHPHHTADQARAKALDIVALRARGEPIPHGFAILAEPTPALYV